MAKRYIDTAEQAQLIRAQLKKHFPGVKFGVRISRYSGGSSVAVKWTDGPTVKAVEKITGPFKGGGFDGMIDLAYSVDSWLCPDGSVHYAKSVGTKGNGGADPGYSAPAPVEGAELVSFSGNYVNTDRTISPELATQAIAALVEYWGGVTEIPVAVPGYFGHELEPKGICNRTPREDLGGNGTGYHYSWSSLIRRWTEDPSEFSRTPAAPLEPEPSPAVPLEPAIELELPEIAALPSAPVAIVSREIAEAFGMVGLPNVIIARGSLSLLS